MTEIPSVDLGNGAAMPMLGFGTWQLQGELAYEATRHALLIGYRHIDTATMYRNEDQVGRAIADSGVDRAELFVTTKLPPGNAGRARTTITESLKALGTDYVDLWLGHLPPRGRDLGPPRRPGPWCPCGACSSGPGTTACPGRSASATTASARSTP